MTHEVIHLIVLEPSITGGWFLCTYANVDTQMSNIGINRG